MYVRKEEREKSKNAKCLFPLMGVKKKKVEGKKCSSLEMLIARYCTVRRREYYRGARYSKRKSQVKKDSVVEFIWQ